MSQSPWGVWLRHAAGVGLLVVWLCGVCGIDLVVYVACVVYPGTALILLRSLVEHRAAMHPEHRTAIVERAGLLGVLYLHNNLHALHHERPSVPWFDLPAQWSATRQARLDASFGPLYSGYREVAARFAWRPHHTGPYPF